MTKLYVTELCVNVCEDAETDAEVPGRGGGRSKNKNSTQFVGKNAPSSLHLGVSRLVAASIC